MKKLEIEKTKPTFVISTFKTDIIKVGLVFSISNFFITKTSLANKWMRKEIPSCSNSALMSQRCENAEKSISVFLSHPVNSFNKQFIYLKDELT